MVDESVDIVIQQKFISCLVFYVWGPNQVPESVRSRAPFCFGVTIFIIDIRILAFRLSNFIATLRLISLQLYSLPLIFSALIIRCVFGT